MAIRTPKSLLGKSLTGLVGVPRVRLATFLLDVWDRIFVPVLFGVPVSIQLLDEYHITSTASSALCRAPQQAKTHSYGALMDSDDMTAATELVTTTRFTSGLFRLALPFGCTFTFAVPIQVAWAGHGRTYLFFWIDSRIPVVPFKAGPVRSSGFSMLKWNGEAV